MSGTPSRPPPTPNGVAAVPKVGSGVPRPAFIGETNIQPLGTKGIAIHAGFETGVLASPRDNCAEDGAFAREGQTDWLAMLPGVP